MGDIHFMVIDADGWEESPSCPMTCVFFKLMVNPKSWQACFTPLFMFKAADVEPSKTTVPFMSSWKDLMMLRSLGGHPILGRILKRPSLLTRSKAFVRSMKATKSGCLCSLHFS